MSADRQPWTRETWAQEALRRSVEKVSQATPGDRHNVVYGQSKDMGAYVLDGAIDRSTVETTLIAAAEAAGLSGKRSKEARRAVHDGLGDAKSGAWYPASVTGMPSQPSRRRVRWRGQVIDLTTRKPVIESVSTAELGLPTVPLPSDVVRLTWYDGVRLVQGRAESWTWDRIEEAVREPRPMPRGGREALPLWSAHEVEGDNRGKRTEGLNEDGTERERECGLSAVHALVLDYDDEPNFNPQQVRKWWSGVRLVSHTSAHHLAEKRTRGGAVKPPGPRGRVFLALSRPVNEAEYAKLGQWALTCGRGAVGRKELVNVRLAFFVPVLIPDYWWDSVEGGALDVDAILSGIERLEQEVTEATEADAEGRRKVLEQVQRFRKNGEAYVPATLRTAHLILGHDPHWRGRIKRNEHSDRTEVDDRGLDDDLIRDAAVWLEETYETEWAVEKVRHALLAVGNDHRYHPIRDYLDGLPEWDGTCRLDRLLVQYFGAENTTERQALYARYGRNLMVSLVARALEPGCKVDDVLTLQGGQGLGKSTGLAALMPVQSLFSDDRVPMDDQKRLVLHLRTLWLVEFADFASIKRADADAVKAFVTQQKDMGIPMHGREPIIVPRSVVFVATANDHHFLIEAGRRWCVVRVVRRVDVVAIRRDRDLLFAEALHRYRAGERWWLPEDLQAEQRQDAEEHAVTTPLVDRIRDWTGEKSGHPTDGYSITELWEQIVTRWTPGANPAFGMNEQHAFGRALKDAGWRKVRPPGRQGGGTRWYPPKM